MIIYGIEVIFCSAMLFVGYLFLRRKTTSNLLRIYLLGIIGISLMLPLIQVDFLEIPSDYTFTGSVSQIIDYIPSEVALTSNDQLATDTPTPATEQIAVSSVNWYQMAALLYFAVSAVIFGRLIFGIVTIVRIRNKSKIVEINGLHYYSVADTNFVGASFFNWIFIGKIKDKTALLTVLEHEAIHRRLWHSLDIVLSEMYCALFWISPIAWLIRREIKLNIEFETDHYFTSGGNTETYPNLLIRLASTSKEMKPTSAFGATSLKRRIVRMKRKLTISQTQFALISLLFLIPSFLVVSCNDPVSGELRSLSRVNGIRTITTRFASHQQDTKGKDNKIVAIARYDSAGILADFTQHMTYPYNLTESYTREFWDEPDPEGVKLIMDGLDLNHAEINFLYGNAWPVKYAIQNPNPYVDDHAFQRNIIKMQGQFPLEMETMSLDESFKSSIPVVEKFTYSNGQISSYKMEKDVYIIIQDAFKKLMKDDRYRDSTYNSVLQEAEYKYAGELLTEISSENVLYRFTYDVDRIVKSEYYLNDQLYNYREYFYDEEGEKIRTEIFNVSNQPEYTIFYDYEYY